MKYYLGQRDENGIPKVSVVEDGVARPLKHINVHSPDGFEWGYAGSGPADLALAICADVLGERWETTSITESLVIAARSVTVYEKVKEKIVVGFPHALWSVTEEQVKAIILEIEAK